MKLARVNTLLLVLILLINTYIIALPAIPGLVFWWQQRDGSRASAMQQRIEQLSGDKHASKQTSPSENRLLLPAMGLDQEIFEGKTERTLNKGLWHRPNSSTPDKGGNTVFVGHRLTYTNPQGTLYHLDKVRHGDIVGVWWNNTMYTYKVTEIKTVGPDEISVEAPTDEPRLTIYTCTPLWLPKDRLVVIAEPERR